MWCEEAEEGQRTKKGQRTADNGQRTKKLVASFWSTVHCLLSTVRILLSIVCCAVALFASPDLDSQTHAIADQLRCPVCRGVPISESPSSMALDMMEVVRQKLNEGRTEEEILNYFENRYGEWILLKPKPSGFNLVIWILPLFVLLAGGLFLVFTLRKWAKTPR